MVKIVVEFFTPGACQRARLHRKEIIDRIEKALSEGQQFSEDEYAVNMTQE